MIVLPISQTEIRAMHGCDAALPALSLLAAAGMGLSLEHMETGTGYKRHALIRACRLLRHMNLVDFEEPRANALRNIRMIAAVQLPLPGTQHTHNIPAGTVSELTGGEAVTPRIRGVAETQAERVAVLPAPPARGQNLNHANLTSVVVGVVNQRVMSLYSQQQHQQTGADSRSNPASQHERFRARGLLKALGMWPNAIDACEDADLADVLGWVAYVSDPANKIGNKPALVSANLKAGRPAGGAYRPFRVCRACHKIETVCECETQDLHLPDDYDRLAIQPPAAGWGETADDWLRRRWHCPECCAHPCQCEHEE